MDLVDCWRPWRRATWFGRNKRRLHSQLLVFELASPATLAAPPCCWPVARPSHQEAPAADLSRCSGQATHDRPARGSQPMAYGLHLWLETGGGGGGKPQPPPPPGACCRPRWLPGCDAAFNGTARAPFSSASHSPGGVRAYGAVMCARALRREPKRYAKPGATEPLGMETNPPAPAGELKWRPLPPLRKRTLLTRSRTDVRQQQGEGLGGRNPHP